MSLKDEIKFVFTLQHTFLKGVTVQRSRNVFLGVIIKWRARAWKSASGNPAFLLASGLILAICLTAGPELEPGPEADMNKPFDVKASVVSLPEKSSYGYQVTLKPISIIQDGVEIKHILLEEEV